MREATAVIDNSLLGNKIKFKIIAYNSIGDYVESETVCFMFATIPPAPSSGPVVNHVTSNSITVTYSAGVSDGGSPIISYHLQYAHKF